MKDLIKLASKNIFSVDTRGKSMNRSTFYNQISKNLFVANKLKDTANAGFYKVGQLLVKAKKELGSGGYGKLKKQLANDGLHIKQQERYKAIALNPDIKLLFLKLPPEWTFWEKLTRLIEKDKKDGTDNFQKVKHLIDPTIKWKDVELKLGKGQKILIGRSSINNRDNRTEIFGLEYDFKIATKKHKDEFLQFEKEVKKLASKYKFIKLKEKNYLDDARNILSEDRSKTKDDTTKEEVKIKMKSYNPKRKIDI